MRESRSVATTVDWPVDLSTSESSPVAFANLGAVLVEEVFAAARCKRKTVCEGGWMTASVILYHPSSFALSEVEIENRNLTSRWFLDSPNIEMSVEKELLRAALSANSVVNEPISVQNIKGRIVAVQFGEPSEP